MENTFTQNDIRPRFSDRSEGLMEASKTSGRVPHKNQTAQTASREMGNAQATATPVISTDRASIWLSEDDTNVPLSPPSKAKA